MPRDIDGTVVDRIDFAISNPLPLAATPRRGFAPTAAYRRVAALLLAALRTDSLDARNELLEFPSLPWTIRVLRVTSAPLRVALDAFLPRHPVPDPGAL